MPHFEVVKRLICEILSTVYPSLDMKKHGPTCRKRRPKQSFLVMYFYIQVLAWFPLSPNVMLLVNTASECEMDLFGHENLLPKSGQYQQFVALYGQHKKSKVNCTLYEKPH